MFDLLLKATQAKQSQLSSTHRPSTQKQVSDNNKWRISADQLMLQMQQDLQAEQRANNQLQYESLLQNQSLRQPSTKVVKQDIQLLEANHFSEQKQEYESQQIRKSTSKGTKKLNYLRMRNAISDMKQFQYDLVQYLEDQRGLMDDFREKICLDIEDFFIKYRNKLQTEQHTKLQTQSKTLPKDQQSSKSSLQQATQLKRMNSKQDPQTAICSHCQSLQGVLGQTKSELKKSQLQIENLLIENQQLQETIFDIEQKLAGLDLEVERRMQEKLVVLPELHANNNTAELQKCREEIRVLQLKCSKLQQNAKNNVQIDARLQKLQKRQIQLKTYQGRLKDAEQQHKQANYEREGQILQAEENLSKKIHDLSKKERELSLWEAELTRKAGEVRTTTMQLTNPNQENIYRAKCITQLQNSREMSLKSFGKQPEEISQEQIYTKLSPREKHYQLDHNQRKIIHQPQRQYYGDRLDPAKKRVENRPYLQNHYATKIRDNHNPLPKRAPGNYRDNREGSPYHNVVEQRGRMAQHAAQPHYRDLSRGSRHSAAKSIASGYGGHANTAKTRNEGQLTGLGSKLERLRQEIKKEIQSIK